MLKISSPRDRQMSFAICRGPAKVYIQKKKKKSYALILTSSSPRVLSKSIVIGWGFAEAKILKNEPGPNSCIMRNVLKTSA